MIKSYTSKIIRNQFRYYSLEPDDLQGIIGFVSGYPVQYCTSEDQPGDIIGFTKSGMHYCVLHESVVYMSLLSWIYFFYVFNILPSF